MRKTIVTKKYLLRAMKRYVNSARDTPLNVRAVAKYANISTQPIYLQFSNFENYKKMYIHETLKFIHTKYEGVSDVDAIVEFWMSYYRFAKNYPNTFNTLFLTDISCGDFIKQENLNYFEKALANSNYYFQPDIEVYELHTLSVVYIIGLIITEINSPGLNECLVQEKIYQFYKPYLLLNHS